MTLVGGGLHSMPPYTHHLGPHPGMLHHSLQVPQQDRPFKCDECPQSFNRNHDLKRHKKIHLAVKPFPCGHCDKSFSRKDALKVRLSSLFFVFNSFYLTSTRYDLLLLSPTTGELERTNDFSPTGTNRRKASSVSKGLRERTKYTERKQGT